MARFREHNAKGYIGTIWFGPFPYINNLCSCASPECAGIRPRVDFGINSIYKAGYLIDLNESACSGCGACVAVCSFGALHMDKALGRPVVDLGRCYGCGVCRHACSTGALFLVPRDQFPALAGRY